MVGAGALDGVVIADVRADALIAIEAVRTLHLRGCALDARQVRTLLRLDVPVADAEIADSRLLADAGALVELRMPVPPEARPLRVGGGSSLSAVADDLPPLVELTDAQAGQDGTGLAATIDEAVAAATARLAAIDPSLGR